MTAALDPGFEPLGFHHEAAFYAGADDYLALTVPFIEEGLAAGEPVLVAVPAPQLASIRSVFGDDTHGLSLVDMEAMGRNPAWIIPAWADFVDAHSSGGPARGIGEPVWSGRSADELVECARHEALINVAFGNADGFTLLCPYDSSTLAPQTLDEAHRNHPHVSCGGRAQVFPSPAFVASPPSWLDNDLTAPPDDAQHLPFDVDTLGVARRSIAEAGAAAGLAPDRVDDLVLAVSEAATNTIRHAGGTGELRFWSDGGVFVCDIVDDGRIDDPLAGRRRPPVDQIGGRGLWLIQRACDLVQIRSGASGQVVRLHLGV